jgi:hypothetical protein
MLLRPALAPGAAEELRALPLRRELRPRDKAAHEGAGFSRTLGLTNKAELQIALLDPDAGFELEHPIRHDGHAAWLRGQRYTSSKALKAQPATTEELRAAGG